MQEIHKFTQYISVQSTLSLNIPCRDLGRLLVLEELPLCRVLDTCGALKPAER